MARYERCDRVRTQVTFRSGFDVVVLQYHPLNRCFTPFEKIEGRDSLFRARPELLDELLPLLTDDDMAALTAMSIAIR